LTSNIVESKGPIIDPPIRSRAQVEALRALNPAEALPFVGEVFGRLRQSVGHQAAVLASSEPPGPWPPMRWKAKAARIMR